MDHRHTEDFARQLEAAALRAGALRRESLHAMAGAAALALAHGVRWAWHHLTGSRRADSILPEA